MTNTGEMAECELRQRKKEESGENDLRQDNDKIGTAGLDLIQAENKTEPVSFILKYVIVLCEYEFYSIFHTYLIVFDFSYHHQHWLSKTFWDLPFILCHS